jgi:hypothetical protein
MRDAGDARRRKRDCDRLIEEIHQALLRNKGKLEASPDYGRIVYRRTPGKELDIQLTTKLDGPAAR